MRPARQLDVFAQEVTGTASAVRSGDRAARHDILFHGTLTQCAVYPREIGKSALCPNAVGAVLVHNHPSGQPDPSEADHVLTKAVEEALKLVDVRALDHIIVAGTRAHSLSEHDQI